GVLLHVGSDPWRGNRSHGVRQKSKRLDTLRRIQQHTPVPGDPVTAESPQHFQKVCDESFILLTLPDKSPTVIALRSPGDTIQLLERGRWSRNEVGSVIKDSCVGKCRDSIKMPLISARFDVSGQKLIAFFRAPSIGQIEQPSCGCKFRNPDEIAIDDVVAAG